MQSQLLVSWGNQHSFTAVTTTPHSPLKMNQTHQSFYLSRIHSGSCVGDNGTWDMGATVLELRLEQLTLGTVIDWRALVQITRQPTPWLRATETSAGPGNEYSTAHPRHARCDHGSSFTFVKSSWSKDNYSHILRLSVISD